MLIIAISRKITSQGNVNNNNNNNKNKLVHINFIHNIGVYKLGYANKPVNIDVNKLVNIYNSSSTEAETEASRSPKLVKSNLQSKRFFQS